MDLTELKSAKARKKMSLRTIAEQSGLPLRTVENIFGGVSKSPRVEAVTAIRKALGLENGVALSADETRLLVAYAALKPATQQTILDMIENFAKEKGEL